jgi:hypothetical protein
MSNNLFTLTHARKAAKDQGLAREMVAAAASDYRSWQAEKGTKTVQAAYATWAAVQSGLLGTDRAHPGVMKASQYAEMYDVSPSNVLIWRRCGVLLSLGMKVTDKAKDSEYGWTHLSRGAVNVGAVGKAIDAADATLESIRAAWDSVFLPDGTKRTKPAKGASGTTDVSEKSDTETAAQRKARQADEALAAAATPLARIGAALTVIRQEIGRLTTDEWSGVEDALQKIVTKEVTIRRKAAAKAAAQAAATADEAESAKVA